MSIVIVLGGATGGIGKEVSNLLDTYMTDRVTLDVGCEASIQGWVTQLNPQVKNAVHIVNATGVSVSSMIHKADVLDVNRMLRVNLIGNLLLLKHLRPLFKVRKGSTFTMLGSVTCDTGPVGTAAYTMSKAGLRGLVAVASKEFAAIGARVNLLEIGYSSMGMIEQVADVESVKTSIPLQRLVDAQEIANAIEFLIGNTYMNGAIVKLNGGLSQ